MEKSFQRDIITPIRQRINRMDEEWKKLYNSHFLHALRCFQLGMSNNPEYFRDCMSRCHKVFEGVLKKLYETLLIINPTLKPLPNKKRMAGNIIKEFQSDRLFPRYFREKLDDYRNKIRNIETHEVFTEFSEENAKESLHNTIVFLFLAYSTDYALKNSDKLNDKDIVIILTSAFIESLKMYTQQFKLYHINGPYLFPDNKKDLISRVEKYYNISPYKTYFKLEKNPKIRRMKLDFKVSFINCELLLIFQKISEMEMINYHSFIINLKRRLSNLKNSGNNIYLIYWCFTSRFKNKKLDFLPELDIPIQIIDSLEKESNKRQLMDYL